MKSISRTFHALCLISACLSTASLAQETNRQNLSADKKTDRSATEAASAAAALFTFHPINSWVGQRFIFLPGPKASENSAYEDFSGKVIRKQYQGRIAKVISVSEFDGRAHVEYEMEDTQERLRAQTLPNKETVKGMALVDDLNNARSHWMGKTLWCKQMMISTYDELSDAVSYLRIKRYSPLKVADVIAGWDEEKPIRVVLEAADGRRGFVDLNLSGTNVFQEVRHLHRFDHCLLTEDPRKSHKWPAQTWNLIENSQIAAGMTMEQVKMSWGEPEKITRTAAGENWVYPGGTLTFKNGALSGMQN